MLRRTLICVSVLTLSTSAVLLDSNLINHQNKVQAQTAPNNSSNISGTWDVEANKNLGTLEIQSNGNNLSGNIFTHSIEGYYVPATRRIVFVRIKEGMPFQFYEGRVSENGR